MQDKIEVLGKIIKEYENNNNYAEALYKIKQLEPNNFNYNILCNIFDEAIQTNTTQGGTTNV